MAAMPSATIQNDPAWLAEFAKQPIRPGLERIHKLLAALGHPETCAPVVHVAGTNGKGSVSHMVATLLQATGKKVGHLVSPHLHHVRERILINGQPIASSEFKALGAKLTALCQGWPEPPSYFEILTALAFAAFAQGHCEVLVIETGMGGRLDATNVLDEAYRHYGGVGVITGIGLDHQDWLGPTLADIAREKAGIARPNVPLVLGPSIAKEALASIQQTVPPTTRLWQTVTDRFSYQGWDATQGVQWLEDSHADTAEPYDLGMLGTYQAQNLATAFTALDALADCVPALAVGDTTRRQALARLRWPGRFEWFAPHQAVLDVAHNPQGMAALRHSLELYFPGRPRLWLMAIQTNRPIDEMLTLAMTPNDALFWLAPDERYPKEPPEHFQAMGSYQNAAQALAAIRDWRRTHQPDALIVVAGSIYSAGAAREWLLQPPPPQAV